MSWHRCAHCTDLKAENPLAKKTWTPFSPTPGLLWTLKAVPQNRGLTGTQGESQACCSVLSHTLLAPVPSCPMRRGEDQARAGPDREPCPSLCVPTAGLRGTGLLSGVSLPPAGPRQDTQPQGECHAEMRWPGASGRSLGEREECLAEKEGDRAARSHREHRHQPPV